jgi:membrane protein
MVGKLRPVYGFLKDVYQEFTQDRGPLFAAAISFFGLLSIIPLILLAFGVFGLIIGSYQAALDKVLIFARDFLPVGTREIKAQLRLIIAQSSLLSGIGLLGLLWTGSQVFVILQQVMNIALGSRQHLGFIRTRVVAFAMVMVAGILFALSIGITSLLTAVRGFDRQIWGIKPGDLELLWGSLGVLIPVLISILAFTMVYKFLPAKNIGYIAPIVGGVTAGVLFEIAKYAFQWYVANFADFALVYGSLGGLVILVLWVYYSSMITVLGAEVASVYAGREEKSRNS